MVHRRPFFGGGKRGKRAIAAFAKKGGDARSRRRIFAVFRQRDEPGEMDSAGALMRVLRRGWEGGRPTFSVGAGKGPASQGGRRLGHGVLPGRTSRGGYSRLFLKKEAECPHSDGREEEKRVFHPPQAESVIRASLFKERNFYAYQNCCHHRPRQLRS